MALILVGVTVYLAAKLINDYEIPKIIPEPDEFHKYSGIHPDLYMEYLDLKKNGKYVDAQNNLEELALYAHPDFRDEIHEKILKKQVSLFN